uniref:Uncharacterized protein n=1 Tax=Arundo donax TaxID=35708 RepID=A0A0A9FM92_ARUDO
MLLCPAKDHAPTAPHLEASTVGAQKQCNKLPASQASSTQANKQGSRRTGNDE